MTFGYSVGDFLGVLKLACDLAKALSNRRGASAELRRLVERLGLLECAIEKAVQTITEWDFTHPNLDNKAPLTALAEEHHICRRLLEDSWRDSKKYTQSIINGKGRKVKQEWAKIKWCMFHSDDILQLELNLGMHVTAINIYCDQLRSRILKYIASSNSTALAVVRIRAKELLTKKDFQLSMRRFDTQLQRFSQRIICYSTPMPGDIGSPFVCLFESYCIRPRSGHDN
ncbi:hypothetical protein K440DRAFT_666725 [Wilcoxina mikolae CBS 423.85]|nr:hypothetical protein K440DRAFT_666725 [Wilcoxina mikolae CBS 423.85]